LDAGITVRLQPDGDGLPVFGGRLNGHLHRTGVWLGSEVGLAWLIGLVLEQAAGGGRGEGPGQQRTYAKKEPVRVALPPAP
jgi:hypothetical protein